MSEQEKGIIPRFIVSVILFVGGFIANLHLDLFGGGIMGGFMGGWILGGAVWGLYLTGKWFPSLGFMSAFRHMFRGGMLDIFAGVFILMFKIALVLIVAIVAMPISLIQFLIVNAKNKKAREANIANSDDNG